MEKEKGLGVLFYNGMAIYLARKVDYFLQQNLELDLYNGSLKTCLLESKAANQNDNVRKE